MKQKKKKNDNVVRQLNTWGELLDKIISFTVGPICLTLWPRFAYFVLFPRRSLGFLFFPILSGFESLILWNEAMTDWLSSANVVVDLERREVRNTHEVPLLVGDGGKAMQAYFLPEKLEESWKSMGSNVAMVSSSL